MKIDTRFLKRVRGGFSGLAIGDALGVPVEIKTHEEIMRLTDGKGVTGYMDPKLTRVKDTQGLPLGSTSDDTQLALVTSRSLIRSRGFNLTDQGLGLVEEFERSLFGWGGTTKEAAIAIKSWRDSNGAEGRHPEAPTPMPEKDGASAGSGPAMKVFPLAAFCLFGRDSEKAEMEFLSHAMDLGRMTHGDLRASVASVALGYAIAAFSNADAYDSAAHFRTEVSARLMALTLRAESVYKFCRSNAPPFSEYLARAFALLDDPVALRTEVNASFLAVHSVPFAIATALRHPDDFRTGVLEGVNAGRDTDTVGSMVGAMIGSNVGPGGIPAEWFDGLRDKDKIVAEADALCIVMYGGDPLDAKRILPPWERAKQN